MPEPIKISYSAANRDPIAASDSRIGESEDRRRNARRTQPIKAKLRSVLTDWTQFPHPELQGLPIEPAKRLLLNTIQQIPCACRLIFPPAHDNSQSGHLFI